MKFDEPVVINSVKLEIVDGLELVPRMKVTKLGKIKRSSFEMKDGMYMEYEGIYIHPNGDSPKIAEYAIFNSPGFDVAEDKFKYRYAFRIARVDGLCFAFIVGPGWTKGCWDIRLDSIELFKENEITRAK